MTPAEAEPPPPSDRATATACGAHVQLYLVVDRVGEVPVPAQLTYTRADPYAVRLHCLTGPTTTVTWVLARETLRQGLRRPTGLGDVRIRPDHPAAGGSVLITLGSGPDAALLRCDATQILRFLTLSDGVVPRGAERRYLDLDALIAQLRSDA